MTAAPPYPIQIPPPFHQNHQKRITDYNSIAECTVTRRSLPEIERRLNQQTEAQNGESVRPFPLLELRKRELCKDNEMRYRIRYVLVSISIFDFAGEFELASVSGSVSAFSFSFSFLTQL